MPQEFVGELTKCARENAERVLVDSRKQMAVAPKKRVTPKPSPSKRAGEPRPPLASRDPNGPAIAGLMRKPSSAPLLSPIRDYSDAAGYF